MKISRTRYLALAAAASVFAVAIPGVASATETGPAAQPSASASPSSPADLQEAPPAEEATEQEEATGQEEATEQEETPKQSGDSSGEASADKADSSPGISIQANPDCKGAWHVAKWKKFAPRLGRVGPNFSSYFGNGGTQTLTAGITGTVSVTASSKIEGGLSAATFVTAKAEVSGSLSTSVAVTASLAETQPVPAKKWGNAYWGATTLPVTFHAKYFAAGTCKITKSQDYTMYYPFNPVKTLGWCKWVSKSSLGSRPAACNTSGFIPA